jgi:phosphoserine phosphatase RsbU/P
MRSPEEELPAEDLEDLYENAPCGYLSMRSDGCIYKVNATFCHWMGYPAQAMTGRRMHEFLNIAGRIFYETHFAPLLRMQGFFNEVALDFVTAQGERLPVLVNAAERRGPDGEALFVRVTVFNATDRRRYERELVEARAAAETSRKELEALNNSLEVRIRKEVADRLHAEEEAMRSHTLEAVAQESLRAERELSKLREQFIAVLGHDLRNPLAAIKAGIDLISRRSKNEAAAPILGMMQSSVVRMSRLIDDILDFARGRMAGGLVVHRDDEASLEATLNQVVGEFRSIAPDRSFETHFSLTEPVSFDQSRISQLVSNLLGNALTHGAAAAPVRLGAAISGETLELWVANAGDPIPAKAMERLFQPFFRGEVRHSQQGLGLGLYIASEIARAHGGTLTVASSTAETRFTLRMPVRAG